MEKSTAHIKQINWLDQETSEAEVLFEVDGESFRAFCYPCDFTEGETSDVNFDFIERGMSESAFWNENKEEEKKMVQEKENNWGYYCFGQIKGIHPVTIDSGPITFSQGDWINDERAVGAYVYFVIDRLDIRRSR